MKNWMQELIVGTVTSTKNEYAESVFHKLAAHLDTENLYARYEFINGKAFFIGVPAYYSAKNILATPLLAAFQFSSNHKGNGVYYQNIATSVVAIIRQENTIKIVNAALDDIKDEYKELSFFDVTNSISEELEPFKLSMKNKLLKHYKFALKKLIVPTSVIYLCALFLYIGNLYLEEKAKQFSYNLEEDVLKIISKFNERFDLSKQLYDLEILASVVNANDGIIKKYQFKDGVSTFILEVPPYITQNEIARLGTVETKLDKEREVLIISRGIKHD